MRKCYLYRVFFFKVDANRFVKIDNLELEKEE